MQSLQFLSIGKELLQESKRKNQLIENQPPIDLPTVNDAGYQSADVLGSSNCVDGTRLSVQEKIAHWVNQEVGEPIFWLQGPAGAGKSTIARTVAHSLHRNEQLLAGYFFKRGERGRNGTARLFPTIAMQLVSKLPFFKSCLRRYIKSFDKNALESQTLKFQFEQLLLKPLADLPINDGINQHHVIIIDALDECECRSEDLSQILELLCRLHELSAIHLRVLLTSRPTPQIEQAFKPLQQGNLVCGLDLYRDFSIETQADIQIYLKNKLVDITTNALVNKNHSPAPEELDVLLRLATNPEPLFIYATTLCRFVFNERSTKVPREQLNKWLEQCDGHKSQLNQMYEAILRQAFPDNEDLDPQLSFLLSLPLLATPLSINSMTSLLDIDTDKILWWLPKLHAVLDIPSEDDKPIQLLHKSFSDFLLSPDNKHRVDATKTHAMLAAKCIERMRSGLKRDICNIQVAGTPRDEIEKQTINDCIPADLKYACLNWVHHLQHGKQAKYEAVNAFLESHFLHWLEALSLLGELSSGIIAVRELSATIKGLHNVSFELINLVDDAYRFILSQKGAIEVAPLQTYTSALIFSPTKSLIKQLFHKESPTWVEQAPKVAPDWNVSLQSLEGHSFLVLSVTISTDGRRVVSGSGDNTVKLWDAGSGACLQTLKGHSDWVRSVAMSIDGFRVASGSGDKTVKLWDAESGACLQTLKGHCASVLSVTISTDGCRVASSSYDKTVKLWDAESGACLQTLEGHSASVWTVAMSTDGRRIASGSGDKTVKLWDAESGACLQTLEGHSASVWSVAISTDGRRVASGSGDKTVKLWDAESGACQQTLDVGRAIFHLLFDPDHHSRLLSDTGDMDLYSSSKESSASTQVILPNDYGSNKYGISADNVWIVQDGVNLIWLPPEYRPSKSRVTGSTITIGCRSGSVWVIRLARMGTELVKYR